MRLITTFTNERGESYTVLQLIKRLRNAIIQIDGILFEHQGRIEVLEIDVEEIKNNIDDIKEQLLDIVNRVDIVENKVEIVEETLITIESNITSIENNITSIETILNTHSGDILAINTNVTNITTELNELQGIVDSIPIVSASPLNGYIKIDGIDTPVFVGSGGSGGSGGGGAIVADYPQKTVGFTKGDTLLCEFDVPSYNDTIAIHGWLQMYANESAILSVLIKGYDENNEEYLLKALETSTSSSGSMPYNHFQYNIILFKNGYGTAQHKKHRSAKLSFDSTGNISDELMIAELTDIPKIVKVKMYVSIGYNMPHYRIYPFCVYLSRSINDENGGSGGSGDTVQTFKTKDVTSHEIDNNIFRNVFTLPVSEEYTNKYKHFKRRYTFTCSGTPVIKLRFNDKVFELEPMRRTMYCCIEYNLRIERLGVIVDCVVSWYNNNTDELDLVERRYSYPTELDGVLKMDILVDGLTTDSFFSSYAGELTAYPFTGELEQEV